MRTPWCGDGTTRVGKPARVASLIPPVAHFIWLGSGLAFVHRLAIRSAALRGAFERVILHHDQPLDAELGSDLAALPGFEARALKPEAWLECASPGLGGALIDLYRGLGRPNARANVLRAALLAREGGVYLDTDTVTVKSFLPLLISGAFCGEEHVVWPGHVRRSRNPSTWAAALARDAVRAGCAAMPSGWRAFRRVEGWYPRAVNNAVIGARPNHPLFLRLLRRMAEFPKERRHVPYALGTHLLQAELEGPKRDALDVTVHPPEVFYPLGPVVSKHWFRLDGSHRLEEVLGPRTRLVHWYASVRTRRLVPRIDAQYIRAHAERQLFSALALGLS